MARRARRGGRAAAVAGARRGGCTRARRRPHRVGGVRTRVRRHRRSQDRRARPAHRTRTRRRRLLRRRAIRLPELPRRGRAPHRRARARIKELSNSQDFDAEQAVPVPICVDNRDDATRPPHRVFVSVPAWLRAPLPERIATPRLVLRRWQPSDAEYLKDAIDASLTELQAWMTWALDEPSPIDVLERRLQRFHDEFGV